MAAITRTERSEPKCGGRLLRMAKTFDGPDFPCGKALANARTYSAIGPTNCDHEPKSDMSPKRPRDSLTIRNIGPIRRTERRLGPSAQAGSAARRDRISRTDGAHAPSGLPHV